jgi:hypothetical protein
VNALNRLARYPWPELLGVAALLIVSVLLTLGVGHTGIIVPDHATSLKESTKETLALMEEMNKLLLSLSSLLIAAVVALVFKEGQLRLPRTRFGLVHLFLVFYTAAFSMYFGFVLYVHMLEMTDKGVFSAANPSVQQPLEWEYYLFLISVALLILRALAVGHGSPTIDRSLSSHEGDPP